MLLLDGDSISIEGSEELPGCFQLELPFRCVGVPVASLPVHVNCIDTQQQGEDDFVSMHEQRHDRAEALLPLASVDEMLEFEEPVVLSSSISADALGGAVSPLESLPAPSHHAESPFAHSPLANSVHASLASPVVDHHAPTPLSPVATSKVFDTADTAVAVFPEEMGAILFKTEDALPPVEFDTRVASPDTAAAAEKISVPTSDKVCPLASLDSSSALLHFSLCCIGESNSGSSGSGSSSSTSGSSSNTTCSSNDAVFSEVQLLLHEIITHIASNAPTSLSSSSEFPSTTCPSPSTAQPHQRKHITTQHDAQEVASFIQSHTDAVLRSHLEDLLYEAVPVMKKSDDVHGWHDQYMAVRMGSLICGSTFQAVKKLADHAADDSQSMQLSGCSVVKCQAETDKAHFAFVLTTAEVHAACWVC